MMLIAQKFLDRLPELSLKLSPNSPIGWTIRQIIPFNFDNNLEILTHEGNAVPIKILICHPECEFLHLGFVDVAGEVR